MQSEQLIVLSSLAAIMLAALSLTFSDWPAQAFNVAPEGTL